MLAMCPTIMKRHASYGWLVCIGWLAFVAPASAASGVRDDAHLYKAATIAKSEQTIVVIHRQYGVELLIENVAGLPADRLAEFKSLKGNAQQEYVTRWAAER